MFARGVQTWMYANWLYAGFVSAVFLLAMLPLLWTVWSDLLLIVFLQLPLYMFHQVEEHHHDRFRLFMNRNLAGGRNALTTGAVVAINIGGVWAVDLSALYLTRFARPGFGLIAVYLSIVNAIVHLIGAVVFRAYNPGLVSAVSLLLPAGCVGWWVLVRDGQCTTVDHVLWAGLAIVIHVAIIVLIRRRVAVLQAR